MAFFKVENLTKQFGGLTAVDDISFEVNQGEVYTIIGPNGAGKTTIFNLVSLIYPPTRGRIFFKDRDLTGLAPDKVAALGIDYVDLRTTERSLEDIFVSLVRSAK